MRHTSPNRRLLGRHDVRAKAWGIHMRVRQRGPEKQRVQIDQFLAGGEKTVCKVRGITLKYNASRLVNFESIRYMILRGVGGETYTATVHTERKIKRKRGNGRVQIVTECEDKTYRVSFLKGDDYTTIRPSPSGI